MANGPQNAEFQLKDKAPIKTHFNPATLQISLSTKVAQSKGKKKGSRQVVNESTAKLSVELLFDTTATGANVCDKTLQIARLVGDRDVPPPLVTFAWGSFKFEGIVDSYKETLDFFSDQGVPLRSTVSLSMTKDEVVLPKDDPAGGVDEGVLVASSGSITQTATQGGAPEAGRDIAAQNGEESMRFPSSASLVVNASVTLSPPVAFSSGGSFGLSGGASFGLSGGASAGISGGASFGLSGGASAGLSVGGGGAGLSEAFAKLRTVSTSVAATARIDPSRLQQRVETNTHAADEGAVFELGGQMASSGSRLEGSVRTRIRIEEE